LYAITYNIVGLVLYVMPQGLSKESLIEDLKDFAKEIGKVPTSI